MMVWAFLFRSGLAEVFTRLLARMPMPWLLVLGASMAQMFYCVLILLMHRKHSVVPAFLPRWFGAQMERDRCNVLF